jgi:hypothetical protein
MDGSQKPPQGLGLYFIIREPADCFFIAGLSPAMK